MAATNSPRSPAIYIIPIVLVAVLGGLLVMVWLVAQIRYLRRRRRRDSKNGGSAPRNGTADSDPEKVDTVMEQGDAINQPTGDVRNEWTKAELPPALQPSISRARQKAWEKAELPHENQIHELERQHGMSELSGGQYGKPIPPSYVVEDLPGTMLVRADSSHLRRTHDTAALPQPVLRKDKGKAKKVDDGLLSDEEMKALADEHHQELERRRNEDQQPIPGWAEPSVYH